MGTGVSSSRGQRGNSGSVPSRGRGKNAQPSLHIDVGKANETGFEKAKKGEKGDKSSKRYSYSSRRRRQWRNREDKTPDGEIEVLDEKLPPKGSRESTPSTTGIYKIGTPLPHTPQTPYTPHTPHTPEQSEEAGSKARRSITNGLHAQRSQSGVSMREQRATQRSRRGRVSAVDYQHKTGLTPVPGEATSETEESFWYHKSYARERDEEDAQYGDAGDFVPVPDLLSFVPQYNARTNIIDVNFEILSELGSGMSGKVYHVRERGTHREYALKAVRHRSSGWGAILFANEYKFLCKLDFPGVVKTLGCYMDDKNYYILTEFGFTDMFKLIKKHKKIDEPMCKVIIKKMLETLAWMHENNIVHRDIKPENVVFAGDDLSQPKLIDWGDSLVVDDEQVYKEFVGTRCYLGPERWKRYQGWQAKASDVWTIGVMTFEMVTGKRCFYGRDEKDMLRKIRAGEWRFPRNSRCSDACAHFISTLLTVDPKERVSARYALQHPWIRTTREDPDEAVELNPLSLGVPQWSTYYRGNKTQNLIPQQMQRPISWLHFQG